MPHSIPLNSSKYGWTWKLQKNLRPETDKLNLEDCDAFSQKYKDHVRLNAI